MNLILGKQHRSTTKEAFFLFKSINHINSLSRTQIMKRTKSINYAAFRKSWNERHLTPVALMVTAVFALAGCEKSDETVHFYQNASDCSSANPGKSEQCNSTYQNALKEAARTAPKYSSQNDCVAEFGEGQCQPVPAPAQTTTANNNATQSGGGIWMPLMAGYMMGSLLNNGKAYAQQPMFSSKNPASPAYGRYADASGRTYGAIGNSRGMTVPGSAMAPKPAATTTITRGGFGESVAKQATMQRTSAGG